MFALYPITEWDPGTSCTPTAETDVYALGVTCVILRHMCGRFVMARARGDLVAQAGAVPPLDDMQLPADFNVAPTKDIAVVLERLVNTDAPEVRREIHLARWGLVPRWAKDLSFGSRTFNARSESVVTKPSFRAAVKARRCAIPVDGYYEWLAPGKDDPPGTRKRPFYVRPADGSLIFFAALYEWWKDPAVEDTDQPWVLSTTMLTGPSPEPELDFESDPNGGDTLSQLGRLHDRLPLPMNQQTMNDWLGAGTVETAEEAQTLVDQVRAQAYATASGWELTEVGPAVGNVRNNGPALIEPREPSV